ncbi:hypothetical protein [Actinomadura sp. K4S16]|nr:hypothetical protein [Actinomadura sp. K4S16]
MSSPTTMNIGARRRHPRAASQFTAGSIAKVGNASERERLGQPRGHPLRR